MPALCSRNTKDEAEPSRIGTSSAVMSICRLSMPRPAQADIRCSTVCTLAPPDDTVEASRVSVTASAVIGISTGSGRSTRRNTMPASTGAGRSVSSTRWPLCSPTPTARVMDLRVRCWSTAAILGARGIRRTVRLAISAIATMSGPISRPGGAGRPGSRNRPCRPTTARPPWPRPWCGWCATRWARPCRRSWAGCWRGPCHACRRASAR